MITKFKIFEEKENAFIIEDTRKLLCIDNHMGELEDKYDLTVGKLYDAYLVKLDHPTMLFSYILVLDNSGKQIVFDPDLIQKNFSLEQSLEEYELKKNAKKYNL